MTDRQIEILKAVVVLALAAGAIALILFIGHFAESWQASHVRSYANG